MTPLRARASRLRCPQRTCFHLHQTYKCRPFSYPPSNRSVPLLRRLLSWAPNREGDRKRRPKPWEHSGWARRSVFQALCSRLSVSQIAVLPSGDAVMRPAPLVLAAVLLLGWAGGAAGTPLIPILAGVALQSHSNIEAARWRHRHHRSYFWGDRGTNGADGDGIAPFSSQPNIDLEATKWRHRHGRDYDWNDRRSGSARLDDTNASGSNANRLTTTDIVRPDLRRRRGWVDPPPAN